MEIQQVAEVLVHHGLGTPALNVLVPNEDNYTVLLMQPHGYIEASTAGVRNRDRDLSRRQFGQFLSEAHQRKIDLAITPEYSMPWETLVHAIMEDTVPAEGKLWAFGCESIKFSELETLKQSLVESASVIFEPLEANRERFVSPLAYVFVAPQINGNGPAKTVVLVQFKTHPMGDPDHFEVNGMLRGTRIYQFGGSQQSLKLVSLICADAFAFRDSHASDIYDRALILHIQLNQDPRHAQFCGCRQRLLNFSGDATEVLCLNWARNVHQCCDGNTIPWHNIAGSAWYLKPDKFDDRDETLLTNHRRGLYYTWLQPLRTHALFFNFEPATYLLNATKVDHIGVTGAISRRRGPQLTRTCVWNEDDGTWVEQAVVEDGFSGIVDESGNAADEFKRIVARDPLEAERVLALCVGKVGHSAYWHTVRELDSFIIDASEVICRLTFCQDTSQRAQDFRIARLKRCGRLWDILKKGDLLPPALADFKEGFHLGWVRDFPHQNAISASRQRATVIYMGEESSTTQIEAIAKEVAEYLHQTSSDINQSLSARQRLAVWFRDENSKIALYDPHRYVRIDQTGDTSEFDIGRET